MVKVVTNTKTFEFSKAEIFNGKVFVEISANTISKLPAAIFRFDNKIYAAHSLTIASFQNEIDILLERELQSTISFLGSHKATIKKLRKITSSYESKFQFGLSHQEIEMLAFTRASLSKYKMLKKLAIDIVGEEKQYD